MAVDLFQPSGRPDAQLHPSFVVLRDAPHLEPARGLLRELQAEFQDPDGNFVEQFQTTGFDSRTFEFFLFSLFRAHGHKLNRAHDRPDFLLDKDGVSAAVEAVTAGQTSNAGIKPYLAFPEFKAPEELQKYLAQNVPIRLGSPLFTKLSQRYWELPHVAGRPFVLAIQDFHEQGSLSRSNTPLARYLYGAEQRWYHDADGKLIITEHELDKHQVGAKEIPSGFFRQPDAEHISAVLFSNSGTIPKFNRMGQEGKHRSDAVRIIRWGSCYRHDPNATLPEGFVYEVGDPQQGQETWGEGTVLMHNPYAIHPLPREWLGASAEEELQDGRTVTTFVEPFLPYSSMTEHYPGDVPQRLLQKRVNSITEELLKLFPP